MECPFFSFFSEADIIRFTPIVQKNKSHYCVRFIKFHPFSNNLSILLQFMKMASLAIAHHLHKMHEIEFSKAVDNVSEIYISNVFIMDTSDRLYIHLGLLPLHTVFMYVCISMDGLLLHCESSQGSK